MSLNKENVTVIDNRIDDSDDDLFAALSDIEYLKNTSLCNIQCNIMEGHAGQDLQIQDDPTRTLNKESNYANKKKYSEVLYVSKSGVNSMTSIIDSKTEKPISLCNSLVKSPKYNESSDSVDKANSRCSIESESSVNNGSAISLLSSQERLDLSSWGLPETVVRAYSLKGIHSMFKWQAECLSFPNVIEGGGNLVYSAPTSAGKTLVAEILMMKRVFEVKKKAIFILPFVSLAREKMFALKDLLKSAHVRVGGFMGQQHPPGGFKMVDVAVCTIEKANSLINRLLEEKALDKLGVIVIDELHLLGDSSRGYLLELLITKIRYMSLRDESIKVQIIGMSATLPNLDLLAQWLNADLYTTDYRPVPLTETIKIGNSVFSNTFQFIRELKPLVKTENDSDQLVYLCLETIMSSHSVLVFCPTKMWCEKLAEAVAKEFFRLGKPPSSKCKEFEDPNYSLVRDKLQGQLDGDRLGEVIEQLKRCPAGLDQALSRTIRFGVAYHHAGLTFDERDIIEGAFKQGSLRVLISTSTLSAGVNLPARRVIVRCPFTFQNRLIDTLSYKQMIGRAGRKGIDTEGESILLCRETERNKVEQLIGSDLEPVSSCLIQGNGETLCSSMKRAILEVIASGIAETPEQVEKYASCTLLSVSMTHESFAQDLTQESKDLSIFACVKFLEENEFIRLQSTNEAGSSETPESKDTNLRYIPTQLGLGCLASSLSPDEALTVFTELQKARKCFVLENELHIIYQVVPIYAAVGWPNLDFMNYLTIWESLPNDVKRVGGLVGVEERFLVRAMRGTINTQIPTQARLMAVHQRFYTALALHDLVNEVKLSTVSRKYGANKGMLQSLQQAASTFAGMVTKFCSRLGWLNLELLIGQFQDRFQFGVQRELIDLCRLTTLNGQRARLLFNTGGMQSVAEVANAKPEDIELLLQNAAPFESGKVIQQGESEQEVKERKALRSFWVTGKKGLTEAEAAILIVEEARELLEKDLGIKIHDWDKNNIETKPTTKGSTMKNDSINAKPNFIEPRGNSSIRSGGTPHLSYLSGTSNVTINNIKKSKLKEKSPLERAKEKIKRHGERTGTGKIIKEKSKIKNSINVRNKVKDHSSTSIIHAMSSPTFKNLKCSSTPVKNHEKSFDTSALIEEIFDVQMEDIQVEKTERSTNQPENGLCIEMFKGKNTQEVEDIDLEDKLSQNDANFSRTNIENNKVHSEMSISFKCGQTLTDIPLKRLSTNTQNNENENICKQLDMSINEDLPSPPKHAKLTSSVNKEHKEISVELGKCTFSDLELNHDELISAPQSADLFGDSLLPENLSDLSCMNKKISSLRNSRSCPNTPRFEVCSEELDVEIDISDYSKLSSLSHEIDRSNLIETTHIKHSESKSITNLLRQNSTENILSHGYKLLNDLPFEDVTSSNGSHDKYSNTKNIQRESSDKLNGHINTFKSPRDVKYPQIIAKNVYIESPKRVQTTRMEKNCNIRQKEASTLQKVPTSTSSLRQQSTPDLNLESSSNKPLFHNRTSEYTRGSPASFIFSDSDTDGYIEPSPTMSLKIRDNIQVSSDKTESKPTDYVSQIIHVCESRKSFSEFKRNIINESVLGCSFACIHHMSQVTPSRKIGQRITRRQINKDREKRPSDKQDNIETYDRDPLVCTELNLKIIGLAVSWRENQVHYVSFVPEDGTSIEPSDKGKTIQNNNENIPIQERLHLLKLILNTKTSIKDQKGNSRQRILVALDMAKFCKIAKLTFNIALPSSHFDNSRISKTKSATINIFSSDLCRYSLSDPRVALWMLHQGEDENTMEYLVHTYHYPSDVKTTVQAKSSNDQLHRLIENTFGRSHPRINYRLKGKSTSLKCGSLALNPKNLTTSSQSSERSIAEALICRTTMPRIETDLLAKNLFDIYHQIEMPIMSILVKSDLNGFGFCDREIEKLRQILDVKLNEIEADAYRLASRKFRLHSSDDVCQILYRELKLPLNGDEDKGTTMSTFGRKNLRAGLRSGVTPSSSKDILSKLSKFHELPATIIKWRKINAAISNTVVPLARASRKHKLLTMKRIYPTSNTFTSTGRMTMQEPSIQMVPRNFPVDISHDLVECLNQNLNELKAENGNCSRQTTLMHSFTSLLGEDEASFRKENKPYSLSIRRAFIPSNRCLLISADYSQMELRILAHMSRDQKLTKLFQNSGSDVFKSIASAWLNKKVGEISEEERQRSKQICYGILYGMGAKSLAEQMGGQDITEEEAMQFMSSFKTAYPEVQSYTEEVIANCRKQGFVETITGRRRYLPNINLEGYNACGNFGGNEYARAAAERQAINTTIQGSAADLIKNAMINIDRSLAEAFPLLEEVITSNTKEIKCGALLVLQLHDELIYEVVCDDLIQVAEIIQFEMENSIKLNVPTPVKMKIGPSWGQLTALKDSIL